MNVILEHKLKSLFKHIIIRCGLPNKYNNELYISCKLAWEQATVMQTTR